MLFSKQCGMQAALLHLLNKLQLTYHIKAVNCTQCYHQPAYKSLVYQVLDLDNNPWINFKMDGFILGTTGKTGKNQMPHPTYLISLTNYSTITVTKYFTVDFICTYDMVNYPFDVQNCNASFMPKANSDVFTKLVPLGHPIYQGTLDLMRYQFQTIEYIHDNVISFFSDT